MRLWETERIRFCLAGAAAAGIGPLAAAAQARDATRIQTAATAARIETATIRGIKPDPDANPNPAPREHDDIMASLRSAGIFS